MFQNKLKSKSKNLSFRQDIVFMIITAVFMGSLTLMNVFSISRFVDLSFFLFGFQIPMLVPVGVMVYPVTFLCTDLVSELYGFQKANLLVATGLLANIWMFFLLWFMGLIPSLPHDAALLSVEHPEYAFNQMRLYALGTMVASLLAYLCAQFLDVYIFEYCRRLTKGKHLWLRNNVSTILSQLVDTVIVVICSYFFVQGFTLPPGNVTSQLIQIIGSCYLFKFLAALLDTIPFYFLTRRLKNYISNEKIADVGLTVS